MPTSTSHTPSLEGGSIATAASSAAAESQRPSMPGLRSDHLGHRVKHLRLFGSRLHSDCIAGQWILRYAGHFNDVEHLDVNVIASEHMSDSFGERNPLQCLPFLEVIFDHNGAVPYGTKKVSELTPWKEEAPCTTQTAAGETIAEPDDRVFSLTEGGAICTFFVEHFQVKALLHPRSLFHRSRSVELSGLHDLMARRLKSMVMMIVYSKAGGRTNTDVLAGIAAHERELLWSFRIMEDMLTRSEEAAALAARLDYKELLAIGEREVKEQEAARAAEADHLEKNPAVDKRDHVKDTRQHRYPTSPTLVALDSYIGGRLISIGDFVVSSDLQTYPYLQSWLPGSLKQARFPAILRYLERMRNMHGFEDALLVRLSFLKVFRRRPKIGASNPLTISLSDRLKTMLDAAKTRSQSNSAQPTTGGTATGGRINPSKTNGSPTNPCNANGKPTRSEDATPSAPGQPPTIVTERFGRTRSWAPRLTADPTTTATLPCTLCEEDEAALRASQAQSQTKTKRNAARHPDKCHKNTPPNAPSQKDSASTSSARPRRPASVSARRVTVSTAAFSSGPCRATLTPPSQSEHPKKGAPERGVRAVRRSVTAEPRHPMTNGGVFPRVWQHDPYRPL